MPNEEDDTREDSSEAPDRQALLRVLRNLEADQLRVKQNAERVYDDKRRELVSDLLPVLDNLDRTLDAATASSDTALIEGVRMVRAQLEGVLVRYGVERFDAGDERFDPKIHDAVAAVPVLDTDLVGRVVRQSAPGYRFSGKVLRAAKVGVGIASNAPRRAPRQAF